MSESKNEWREWWTVEGGTSSVTIVHHRALLVEFIDDPLELPRWLHWSEHGSHWRFHGSTIDMPAGGDYILTHDRARLRQMEQLTEWLNTLNEWVSETKSAILDATFGLEHDCNQMPPIGAIGTVIVSGAKHADIPLET